MLGNDKKKKDKGQQKRTTEKLPKVKKADSNGEKQRIPKGYKATVSKEGTIIAVSKTTDISGKNRNGNSGRKATSNPLSKKKTTVANKPAKAAEAAKKKVVSKAPKSVKKLTQTKNKTSKGTTAKKTVKTIKHDENFERDTVGNGKIFVIKGKPKEKKRRRFKKLRRAGQHGGYTVWDARTGKTFATESEAIGYAAEVFVLTGEIVPVTLTDRKITHTFKDENENEKKK